MPVAELLKCPHCQKPFTPEQPSYKDDYLEIDEGQFLVRVNDKRRRLTAIEHRLLACFVANQNRVLTHRQILASVWGFEYLDDIDYVRLYVWKLRQKIEVNPQNPQYIISENGIGYRFQTKGGR